MRDAKAAQLPQQGYRLVMRLMAVSVAVVALAGAAFSAHAQGHHGTGRGGPGAEGLLMFDGSPRHLDRMLDGLSVTDAQRAQIRQIGTSAAADLKAQRDSGRSLQERGMQLFTAPTVDAAAAESLRQQMSAQREQASKRMLQAMLDVANVLTPEQRAKLGERMKERRAMADDRKQRMQRERPPREPRPATDATPPQQLAPQK